MPRFLTDKRFLLIAAVTLLSGLAYQGVNYSNGRAGKLELLYLSLFAESSGEVGKAALPISHRSVAHAGGRVRGLDYTNSREALDQSYERGFRLFEMDFNWTRDGKLVPLHDWGQTWAKLFGEVNHPSEGSFRTRRMKSGLSQMLVDDIDKWLDQHPDAWIVTDIKEHNLRGLKHLQDRLSPENFMRLIPQIYRMNSLMAVRKLGFSKIILTTYQSDYDEAELLEFVQNHAVYMLVVPKFRKLRDPSAIRQHTNLFVHTINQPAEVQLLQVDGVYSDQLSPSNVLENLRHLAGG